MQAENLCEARQSSLCSAPGFEKHYKITRNAQFLGQMNAVIPWKELVKAIEPFYPKPEGAGRRPIGLEIMLRIYMLQHFYNLSDPAAEDAVNDSMAMRQFVGIDLGEEAVPDETTICKFRHLLEQHNLGERLFELINEFLVENGLEVQRGTIVDATIIAAPSSTKNREGKRDPEMRSTRKGNQWYFGMKLHIGVDSKTKLIHSVATTAANVHDSQALPDLLHGEETKVWGDKAYDGQREAILKKAPCAQDYTLNKAQKNRPLTDKDKSRNRNKSRVRSKGEHPFRIVKQQFGFTKVRYRGLHKNTNRAFVACALTNLTMAKNTLLKAFYGRNGPPGLWDRSVCIA